MANTQWSSTDSLHTTLTGSGLVATSSSGNAAVRTQNGFSTGQYYWECTFTTAVNADTGVGVATSGASLASLGSNAAGGCIIFKGFPVWLNGSQYSPTTSIGTITAGSVVGIACDFTNKLIWFRLGAAGSWNATSGTANNPATGTGGISLSALSGPLFPAASMWSTSDSITANFGDTAFTGTVPSGFTSGVPFILAGVSCTGQVGSAFGGAYTFWNPSDKSAACTLSSGNLVASFTGGNPGVRSVDRVYSGKYYWEFTFTTLANTICGICTATATLTTIGSGPPSFSAIVTNAGAVFNNGGSTGISLGGSFTAGWVLCVAIDATNGIVWFRNGAAGNWDGNAAHNPATGVGGFNLSSFYGPGYSIYGAANGGGGGGVITANFGNTAFTGTVPSGFTSGFPNSTTATPVAVVTQTAVEEWYASNPPAQVTQVSVEEWGKLPTPPLWVTQAGAIDWVTTPHAPLNVTQVGAFVWVNTTLHSITGVLGTGGVGTITIHQPTIVSLTTASLLLTPQTISIRLTVKQTTASLVLTPQVFSYSIPHTFPLSQNSLTLTARDFVASVSIHFAPAGLTLTPQTILIPRDIGLDQNSLTLTLHDHGVALVVRLATAQLTLTTRFDRTVVVDPSSLVITARSFTATLLIHIHRNTLTLTTIDFSWNIFNVPVGVALDTAELLLFCVPFTFTYEPPLLLMTQEGLEVASVGDTALAVTQLTIETASAGESDLRQTQQTVETSVVSATSWLHQTQQSIEAAVTIVNVPVRITQVAVEVLRGFPTVQGWNAGQTVVTPVYPILPGLGYNVKRTLAAQNIVQPHISGKETRIGGWSQSIYQYELTYELLRDWPTFDEYRLLESFWLNCMGQQGVFLFDDPDDDQVTGQVLGIGNGKETQFQLIRTIGKTGEPGWTDTIQAPNRLTAVYLDGNLVDPTRYDLTYWNSNLPGVLSIHDAVPVGVSLTADFSYSFPVRLNDDNATFEKFMFALWELKLVKFETIKCNNILLLPHPQNFSNATRAPGTTAQVPPQAASAGYTTLVFEDDFTTATTIAHNQYDATGYNWYFAQRNGFPADPTEWSVNTTALAASISNGNSGGGFKPSTAGGILQLNTGLFPNANLISLPGWAMNSGMTGLPSLGVGRWSHCYMEAYIQYVPDQNAPAKPYTATGWPAFWSWAAEGIGDYGFPGSGLYTSDTIEVDFLEQFGYVLWGGGGSSTPTEWSAGLINHGTGGGDGSLGGGTIDSNWHAYGFLWTPGRLRMYFDDVQVSDFALTAGAAALDSQSLFLTLGTGPDWQMNIDWVRIWQT